MIRTGKGATMNSYVDFRLFEVLQAERVQQARRTHSHRSAHAGQAPPPPAPARAGQQNTTQWRAQLMLRLKPKGR